MNGTSVACEGGGREAVQGGRPHSGSERAREREGGREGGREGERERRQERESDRERESESERERGGHLEVGVLDHARAVSLLHFERECEREGENSL